MRAHVDRNWPISREKKPTYRLLCKNAVTDLLWEFHAPSDGLLIRFITNIRNTKQTEPDSSSAVCIQRAARRKVRCARLGPEVGEQEVPLDFPQVHLFLNLDLFIFLERSERVIFVRRSREGECERRKSKPTGQGRIIRKDL